MPDFKSLHFPGNERAPERPDEGLYIEVSPLDAALAVCFRELEHDLAVLLQEARRDVQRLLQHARDDSEGTEKPR